MTISDLINKIQVELNDPNGNRYSDDIILDWINEAIAEICKAQKRFIKKFTLSYDPDNENTFFNDNNIPDISHIIYVKDSNNTYYNPIQENDIFRKKMKFYNYTYYYSNGGLKLYPEPSSTKTLTIRASYIPDAYTADDALPFSDADNYNLKYYALSIGYGIDGNLTAKLYYEKKWKKAIMGYKPWSYSKIVIKDRWGR